MELSAQMHTHKRLRLNWGDRNKISGFEAGHYPGCDIALVLQDVDSRGLSGRVDKISCIIINHCLRICSYSKYRFDF